MCMMMAEAWTLTPHKVQTSCITLSTHGECYIKPNTDSVCVHDKSTPTTCAQRDTAGPQAADKAACMHVWHTKTLGTATPLGLWFHLCFSRWMLQMLFCSSKSTCQSMIPLRLSRANERESNSDNRMVDKHSQLVAWNPSHTLSSSLAVCARRLPLNTRGSSLKAWTCRTRQGQPKSMRIQSFTA